MKYRRMWLMIVVAHLIVLTGPIVAAGPATPQPTQLLRVGVSSEPPGLDIQWQTATMTQDIMHHVYEFLFTMDRNLDFKPMLAEKMDVSRDGKIFTIFLRKGVFFHNGKELSAEDVIASMERWVRLEARARRFMQDRESVRARDKYTVEVRFRQPNGAFQSAIAIHNNLLSIMPKEIVEKYWNPDPRGTEIKDVADLIGTGPYRVVEWARDRHVRLVRFDRYAPRTDPSSGMAGQRTAHAQEMRFVVIKDDVTRLNALIAGEIDVAHTLSPAQYAQVRLNAALDPYIVKPGGAPVGVFNKSPGNMFRNEKLRNAVHWSIDYGKVMAGSFDNPLFFRASHGHAPREWAFWYNEAGREFYNRRDLNRARALAQEAGYQGERIRWITTRDFEYMYRSALVASEQMKEAGFNVELIIMDWPTLISSRGKREAYEIFTTGIGFGGDPTATAAFTPDWPGWYDDPENNANYTALLTTVDPGKRKKLFEEQQRLFWVKNPYLRFGDFFAFRAARKEVKGLFARGPAFYWNVWIEK